MLALELITIRETKEEEWSFILEKLRAKASSTPSQEEITGEGKTLCKILRSRDQRTVLNAPPLQKRPPAARIRSLLRRDDKRFNEPANYGSLPTANCQLPTAYCQPPTAHCSLLTANCPLPTTYCKLLPTANCQLLTAYCPFGLLNKLTNNLYAPGTPAGNCLKNANEVYTNRPCP